ncbi:OmpA family protein [Rhodobacter sp. NTK016B]|uniref:flagellar motor protein MotB n=1 Tax=Rhodobacter sp. NTK016B TaxID=2759676 RepID=UPI001A8FC530|nr:flagellar motor protein MotB [Rhodobacter sp. NTK016B]MBN8293320.1 OmpA family protein [Rhodobacter sp. NTK016B]
MSRQNDAAPIIIKRKKVIAGGGHHGGAWKVAYADFVTAMMAFFLMMWLLGATTESQRRGLADYFNPSVPVHRIASGGEGMFGGTDIETSDQSAPATPDDSETETGIDTQAETESLEDLQQRLTGMGGESAILSEALRHVVTRLTDEGLVIEIFDLPDAPLFVPETDQPTPVTRRIIEIIAQMFPMVINPLAIEAHTRAYPIVQANDPGWTLSGARADRVRRMLDEAGYDPARISRVTGHADRRPADPNPMAVRNNRLELILLRRQ